MDNHTFVSGQSVSESREPLIDVVIPTFNEARSIEKVLSEVRKYCHTVLVVDGHSDDGTVELAKKLGARVVVQNGRGKGMALREAFSYVDGDIVVVMDADGSMRACEIETLVKIVASGADFVKGSRFIPGGHTWDMTYMRKAGNTFFVFLVNRFWPAGYTDLCYGFMAFRKDALKKLACCLVSTRFEIEAEICIKACKLGLKTVEVASVELPRDHGKSNLSTFRDGLRILRTVVKEIAHRGVVSPT